MNALTFDTQVKDVIVERFELLKNQIAESISSHGLTASGRTAASMYVVADSYSVTLYGRPFFPALETGSSRWTGGTGISCSFAEFKGIIRNWASSKGLNFGQHKEYERAVSAIAMKIIRNGTKQKRSGQRLDVYTTLVEEAVKDCEKLVVDLANAEIDNIVKDWGDK